MIGFLLNWGYWLAAVLFSAFVGIVTALTFEPLCRAGRAVWWAARQVGEWRWRRTRRPASARPPLVRPAAAYRPTRVVRPVIPAPMPPDPRSTGGGPVVEWPTMRLPLFADVTEVIPRQRDRDLW